MDKEDKKPKKYSAIGLRIKERMNANGISQPELARVASISQSAISQMLSNENPSKHLPKLCIPLKSPFEWLAYGRGTKIVEDAEVGETVLPQPESVTEEVSNFFTIYFREIRKLSPKAEHRVKELLLDDLLSKPDGKTPAPYSKKKTGT